MVFRLQILYRASLLLPVGVALLSSIFVTGCDRESHEKSSAQTCGTVQFEVVGSDYFSIGKLCGVDVAVVRSVVGKDTLVHRFVMMDSSTASLGTDLRRRSFPEEWLSAKVLRIPLKRVAALSTSQVGYLLRLGFRDNIVGVSDGNYIVDSVLYERARPDHGSASDFVQSIGYDADALEKLMALHPDLIFDFTTGGDYDNYEQIARTSLPLMLTSEWQENSPLAKLEWIKLYGILFGVRPLADSIFEQEKNKYETLKNLIASSVTNDSVNPKATGGRDLNIDERTDFQSYRRKTKENVSEENPSSKDTLSSLASRLSSKDTLSSLVSRLSSKDTLSSLVKVGEPAEPRLSSKHCPRVLAGMSYGGVWHASGGSSFTANLIRDAGGCYLWASDSSRELTFSFEQVFALAESVDVWVNPSMFATVDEIVALEPRVKSIKAFKEKRIFQNDGRRGRGAGNDFYEGAITRPAELLWNFAKCINGVVPGVNSLDTTYTWYRNIYNF